MLKIRLRRVGKKKQPSYRVVVADSRAPREGAFLEMVGHYNPLPDPAEIRLDVERIQYWVGHGAQMTEAVQDLLRRHETAPPPPPAEEEKAAPAKKKAAPAKAPAKEAPAKKKAAPAEAPAKEAPAAKEAAESLADLGLSTRFLSILEGEGLTTVDQVVARYREQGPTSLTAIGGFGPKALGELETALRDRGLIE